MHRHTIDVLCNIGLSLPAKGKEVMVDTKFARYLEKAKKLPLQDQQILTGIIDNFLQKNGLKQKRNTSKRHLQG